MRSEEMDHLGVHVAGAAEPVGIGPEIVGDAQVWVDDIAEVLIARTTKQPPFSK